jgi:hypothetical protein
MYFRSVMRMLQELGYFPEALLNLLTNTGSGFKVRETAGMVMDELVSEVCVFHCTEQYFYGLG